MNMQALMQQAQKMQRDITKKKDEINKKEFTGESELVSVVFTGDKKMVSMTIKNDIENDDKEFIQDMVVIATNDAMKKSDSETEKALGAYGSQLGGLF